MPSIQKVAVSNGARVRVTWSRGSHKGTTTEVDIAPLIHSKKVFAPLRNNPRFSRPFISSRAEAQSHGETTIK